MQRLVVDRVDVSEIMVHIVIVRFYSLINQDCSREMLDGPRRTVDLRTSGHVSVGCPKKTGGGLAVRRLHRVRWYLIGAATRPIWPNYGSSEGYGSSRERRMKLCNAIAPALDGDLDGAMHLLVHGGGGPQRVGEYVRPFGEVAGMPWRRELQRRCSGVRERRRDALEGTTTPPAAGVELFGCRSQIDQLGGTSVLRFDNVIWN